MSTTHFLYDEKVFWHTTRDAVLSLPPHGYLQPLTSLGHVENAETKRRFLSLVHVTGLMKHLHTYDAQPITYEQANLVHTQDYLNAIIEFSQGEGGTFSEDLPFGHKGYDYACVSAGLAVQALSLVLDGKDQSAYALTRPPGHHAESNEGTGFCLLANIPIAIEVAKQNNPDLKVLVLDWDVHHGNGTQNIFYNRDDVLALSLHQDGLYPLDSGHTHHVGQSKGYGYTINVPLPAGTGNGGYMYAVETIFVRAVEKFKPDVIIVASGYDAGWTDPLGRMLVTSKGFVNMTRVVQSVASISHGRLMFTHEGGYCPCYAPLCAYKTLETLAEVDLDVQDDFDPDSRQLPDFDLQPHQKNRIDDLYANHPFFR